MALRWALRRAGLAAGLGCSGLVWAQAAVAPRAADEAASAPMEIEASSLRGSPGGQIDAQGPVKLQRGSLSLQADQLQVDLNAKRIKAQGHVTLLRNGDRFSGQALEIGTEDYTGFFLEPEFRIARMQAGGSAQRIDFLGRDRLSATQARYSSCTVDEGQTLPWEISARRLRVDVDANEGVAEGAVLRFYGVPIMAAPAMTFPVTDERKSGLLPPQINVTLNNGDFSLAQPYYWNIAPNRDMTLTPTLSSRRGAGLETEFRYLQPSSNGLVRYYTLPNDQLAGRERWALRLQQEAAWRGGWYFDANLLRVSDDNYWKDGLRNAEYLTPRLLPTQGLLQQRRSLYLGGGEVEQVSYAGVQRWQALQDIDPAARFVAPYSREPQVGVRWRSQAQAVDWSLQTEFNRFSHVDPTFQTGSRAHVAGSVAWPIGQGGWRVTPRVAVNAATYALDRPLADGRTSVARVIPTVSLDSQWTLERSTTLFGRDLTQTLEPRLLYVRTPYRDQSLVPSFDSAPLDFNEISVFADSAFSGIDRVSDANQVTAGVTTRFIDANSGAELGRLGVAQRYLFREQRITPDGVPLSQSLSDVLLFGSTRAMQRWTLDSALQYNPETQRVARTINSVRYSPGPFRTLYGSYRMQRGTTNLPGSEQLALGWQWPLVGQAPTLPPDTPAADAVRVGQALRASRAASSCTGTLYGVGRVNYSMRDQRWAGALVGLEYDAGCWIGRIVLERQSTSLNAATTKLMLQLELIGLSRIGSNPLARLKDNIPGYQLLYDRKAASSAAALGDGGSGETMSRP
ncbi:MAG: LPS assembly protein LptD [Burkholderiales bacterium]